MTFFSFSFSFTLSHILSLSLSISHTHTYKTHTRIHTHTHTHTHTHKHTRSNNTDCYSNETNSKYFGITFAETKIDFAAAQTDVWLGKKYIEPDFWSNYIFVAFRRNFLRLQRVSLSYRRLPIFHQK